MDLDVASEQETLIDSDVPARAPRRQWGSDTRVDPLPAVAPPASDAMMALGRIAIVFTDPCLAFLCHCVFLHRDHQQLVPKQLPVPVRNHRLRRDHVIPGAVLAAVPGGAAGCPVPQPRPSAGAPRGHRRFLRHHPADDDGAGAVLPRGSVDRSQDAALGRAAGVPVPAGRAAARRPTQPDLGRAQGLAGRRPAIVRRAHRVARGAARALRGHPGGFRDVPAQLVRRELRTQQAEKAAAAAEVTALAAEYDWAAAWLRKRAEEEVIVDHVDRFFADRVLGVLAADFAEVSSALTNGIGRRRDHSPAPDAPTASAAGLDVPRGADLVRAQALLVAVARGQQGHEPEQLHRADGPQLRDHGRRRRGRSWRRPGTPARSSFRTPTTC